MDTPQVLGQPDLERQAEPRIHKGGYRWRTGGREGEPSLRAFAPNLGLDVPVAFTDGILPAHAAPVISVRPHLNCYRQQFPGQCSSSTITCAAPGRHPAAGDSRFPPSGLGVGVGFKPGSRGRAM